MAAKEAAGAVVGLAITVAWGLVSLAVFAAAITYFLERGSSLFVAVFFAILSASVPLVSSFLGAYFASHVWGISYLPALLIMFAPYILAMGLAYISSR